MVSYVVLFRLTTLWWTHQKAVWAETALDNQLSGCREVGTMIISQLHTSKIGGIAPCTWLQVIPAGGIALDPAERAVAYASDKTNAAIWWLNMTGGELLAASNCSVY